jgi:two-component sensor histidine kinase
MLADARCAPAGTCPAGRAVGARCRRVLARLLRKPRDGIRLGEHMDGPDGAVMFRHACATRPFLRGESACSSLRTSIAYVVPASRIASEPTRAGHKSSRAPYLRKLCVAISRSQLEPRKINLVTALLHHHAAVHRALQMPEHDSLIDAAAYLRKLCVAISRSQLKPRKINLVLAPQPLRLEAERSWRIGLIVYELVINAAWHAFPRGDGEVRLELLRTGPFVECRVSDNGSSPPKIRPGHGLKIVDELARSLDGRFEQRLGPRGSRSIVTFPLEDAEAQA